MAGVNITREFTDGWNEMTKADSGLRYIIFKLDENKENVVFEKKKMKCECSHEDLLDDLPADEPRYIGLILDYENKEGAKRSKVLLIFWCPENLNPRVKMPYAMTFNDLTKKCPHYDKSEEAHERCELSFEALKELLKNVK